MLTMIRAAVEVRHRKNISILAHLHIITLPFLPYLHPSSCHMDEQKLDFLRNDFIFLLKHLAPDAIGKWGKMNGHQMVEHLVDVVKNASGRLKLPAVNEGEKLEQARAFILSDKPFKENLRNPFMSEDPKPARKQTIQSSIEKLQQELNHFFDVFQKQPDLKTQNPFFGWLNFEENVHMLHKHAVHHLRQFALIK